MNNFKISAKLEDIAGIFFDIALISWSLLFGEVSLFDKQIDPMTVAGRTLVFIEFLCAITLCLEGFALFYRAAENLMTAFVATWGCLILSFIYYQIFGESTKVSVIGVLFLVAITGILLYFSSRHKMENLYLASLLNPPSDHIE